ncbi:MAG: hypothetical protein ABIN01_01270 [Ferruginibacter sp.]
MLNNISWAGYVKSIALIILVYYTTVFILYYRVEILRLISKKRLVSIQGHAVNTGDQIAASDPELFPVVHLLMGELQQLLHQTALLSNSKPVLVDQLEKILTSHQGLAHTAFIPAINKFLIEESSKQCFIHFSEEEVSALWKGSE